MHFVTFKSLEQKIKILFRENCFQNVVSEIHKNDWFVPILRQRLETLLCFFLKKFSNSSFVDTSAFFLTNPRPNFQDSQFSPNVFFCFVIYTLKCLETCVNGIIKCRISRNMCKRGDKLQNIKHKKAFVPLLPGEMKLHLYSKLWP